MSVKEKIKLTIDSVGIVAAVATFMSGVVLVNPGVCILGVLTAIPIAVSLYKDISKIDPA